MTTTATRPGSEPDGTAALYPLADAISADELDRDLAQLEAARYAPVWRKLGVYAKLGGPGFMAAALTLGAGTMTSAMLSGAQFGYKTLWITWVAIAAGLFMMTGMARITARGNFRLIQKQSEYHGWFIARVLTAFLGLTIVAITFNFGQVALGTHLMESLAETAGFSFKQEINWVLYGLLTGWIALAYGRGGKGAAFVETFMKVCLLLMLVCFALCLFVVGIDWGAAAKGFFIPWLPSGRMGIDLFIASTAAAVGVMDWVFFHYAGLAKGWGPRHEKLARMDIFAGLAAPMILVIVIITSVFAGTLHAELGPGADLPGSAAELSRALAPLLGETLAEIAFLIGFMAVPITTTVAMSIACAIGLHEAFGWEPDVRSRRWIASLLLPQIALVAAFAPSPITLIIIVAAALSLTNNVVGCSLFLLLNDRGILGNDRIQSRIWNAGILVQITLLNAVAIMWVMNRFGMWG